MKYLLENRQRTNNLQKSKHFGAQMLLLVFFLSFFFVSSDLYADYISKTGVAGAYENSSNWNASWGGAFPPENGNVDRAMTISQNSNITRNGNINPVTVTVRGTFIVTGNYTNNQWGGVTIENGGKLEVFGDLVGSAAIDVKNGGILIVHGDLNSSGSSVNVHGSLIVAGSFSTSSSTTIRNTGKLVVGGDFTHQGGGLNTQGNSDTKIYIINPDAVITAPGWSIVNNPDNYGDLDSFLANESNDLINIVEQVVAVVSGAQWVGNKGNNNWKDASNWSGNRIPTANSNVRIKASNDNPNIIFGDGLIEVKDLLIEQSATLTLKSGARLTVNGNLLIEEGGNLILENDTSVAGMTSLITKGTVSGEATVKLTLQKNKWYYLSHPISEARTGVYDIIMPGATTANFRDYSHVSFFRNNKWFRITGVNISLWNLEGVTARYLPQDGSDSHSLQYKGSLNNASITRTYTEPGFYLLGNPYPSFIDWQEDLGWDSRANLDNTIWYRTRVNGEMGFATYNRSAPKGARVAVYPDGVAFGDEDEMALIPPMQSVWVRAFSNTQITINPQARKHGKATSVLKSGSSSQADIIRISAQNENSYDGAVIYFWSNSEEGIDAGDSEKRFNESDLIPEIYTKVGDKALAINGLPMLKSGSRILPLSVRNRIMGDVTLKFDMSYYYSSHSVYLEDRDTGAFTNVTFGDSYSYSVTETDERDDRFVLHFYQVSTDLEPDKKLDEPVSGITIRSMAGKVLVSISNELLASNDGIVELFSIEGQKLTEIPARNSRTLVFLPNVSGVYIVRATAGGVVKSERVIGQAK